MYLFIKLIAASSDLLIQCHFQSGGCARNSEATASRQNLLRLTLGYERCFLNASFALSKPLQELTSLSLMPNKERQQANILLTFFDDFVSIALITL